MIRTSSRALSLLKCTLLGTRLPLITVWIIGAPNVCMDERLNTHEITLRCFKPTSRNRCIGRPQRPHKQPDIMKLCRIRGFLRNSKVYRYRPQITINCIALLYMFFYAGQQRKLRCPQRNRPNSSYCTIGL
ncbi:hypothetical protein F4777DRAFT_536685 [Nemania sp. FL0916]|nr:hypothetical protein F4777DRAFT_536685 [Nemania sp. FL0916]